MPDSKITALASIGTGTDPVNDPLVLVDVSDTSMAASGTTKKVTLNNLLSSSPTATGNFTITGDLTVATSSLKVTGGNVGVGTATPTSIAGYTSLTINTATTGSFLDLNVAGVNKARFLGTSSNLTIETAGTIPVTFLIGGQNQYKIDTAGVFTWYDGAGGTRMTLNSTGLGVGGSPVTSHLISAQGPIAFGATAGGTRTSYISNSAAASIYYTDGGASYPFNEFGNLVIQPRTSAARSVVIATGSTTPVERAVVKSTGQVRFVPLAADPSGAEAGDVYYNSVSNRLKYYNGTAWTLI